MSEEEKKIEKVTLMNAQDIVSAKLAQCFITIGKQRYNFMQAINFEAKFEKVKVEIPILGKTGKGNKSIGWKGTGTATFHYNTSIFRNLMNQFREDGKDAYFTIQVVNNDPGSQAGIQMISFLDCNINGGILAKFDADGEYLDEEMEFTFEDFTIDQTFNNINGMMVTEKKTI